MAKKILFAVDDSERCLRALEALGKRIAKTNDYELLLIHCAPQYTTLYPGEIWEAQRAEELARKTQEEQAKKIFDSAISVLHQCGFPRNRVDYHLQTNSIDPGQDILQAAASRGIDTVAVSRRGRNRAQSLLLGSVSSRVAEYAENRTVWVIDAPVPDTSKVLIAVEGVPECRALTYYAAEWIAPLADLHFTILHLLPPLPPTYWDDGHILTPTEQQERRSQQAEWRSEWTRNVEKFMDELGNTLVHRGIKEDKIEKRIQPVKQGIAQDLLNELQSGEFEMVLLGKRSFRSKKPFLIGSHANKILFNAKNTTICLVDSR